MSRRLLAALARQMRRLTMWLERLAHPLQVFHLPAGEDIPDGAMASVDQEGFARMVKSMGYDSLLLPPITKAEPEPDELPVDEVNPPGWTPPEPTREVIIRNGMGGELVLKVRGHAFRVVSFTRPPQHASLGGKTPTIDLWLSTEQLVAALRGWP